MSTIRAVRPALASAILAALGYWGLAFWNLAGHWSANPQYSFGWLVPPLAAFLLLGRWHDRPERRDPQHPAPCLVLMVIAAAAALPVWILEQPNPDWRLVSWALALIALAVTAGAIYLTGGKCGLLHFAIPILFLLASVPWPFDLEWRIIQSLTRLVVSFTVDALNLLGIAAVQHGNTIETGRGMLDVTDACSGIRSLQACLMISLFLGELYRMRAAARLLLVAWGMGIAVICNLIRALFLAYLAGSRGSESIAHWHDRAGFSILAVSFFAVWLLSLRLARPKVAARQPAAPLGRSRLSWPWSAAFASWILLVVTTTEVWYRVHEERPNITWRFSWPESRTGFHDQPISALANDLLKFDAGRSAEWREEDGTERAAFFLSWKPGTTRSLIPARSHRPEVCLTANGYALKKDFGMVAVEAGGISLPFEQYLFEKDGVPVNVFFCLWQDHPAGEGDSMERYWSRYAGLLFALRGQRSISQQVLEFAMFGPMSPAQALSKCRAELGTLIVR